MRVADDSKDWPKKKRCTKCSRVRPIIEYTKARQGKYLYWHAWCKSCRYERTRAYHTLHHVELEAKKKIYKENNPINALYGCWKNVAVRRAPKDHSITKQDVYALYKKQNGLCAISGIKMTWVNGTRRPLSTSISIDRKNNKKGYTKQNIQFVCYAINSFKQDMTLQQVINMAKAIIKHNKGRA